MSTPARILIGIIVGAIAFGFWQGSAFAGIFMLVMLLVMAASAK